MGIQHKYKTDENRDSFLPQQNMWSLENFLNYLKSINKEDIWEDQIAQGMKDAIIGVCLTAQDSVEIRKNSFELYGADFMLDENFNLWLIEVNSSPAMSRSTDVTGRACTMVQEDIIKVVIDRKKNKKCDIGKFSLLFKQAVI